MASGKVDGNWCLIESDPGVFTEIIKGFGVTGIECEEIIDLDYMSNISQTYGLIFLYKWHPESVPPPNVVTDVDILNEIFFAQQVITNACATQAILNILFNLGDEIQLGKTLLELKNFCSSFDSHMKGLTISNSDEIRQVHNSFSSLALYEMDEKKSHGPEDAYHFVSYMPVKGRLYEFDGLQDGPIDHGPISTDQPWINFIKPVICERMHRHSGTHFNMMALVPDRLEELQMQLEILETNGDDDAIPQVLSSIQDEKAKHERYRIENIRRRHNYMPFIIELMKLLAEEGKLTPLIEKAEEMALHRRKRRHETNIRKMDMA